MKRFFILSLVLASTVFAASAQTAPAKFGHVNIQELLTVLPEYKKAETALQSYVQQLQGALQNMENEYRQKVQQYTKDESTMLPPLKEAMQREILDLEKRIQTLQLTSEQQMMEKQLELIKPIEDKIMKAIRDLAEAEGYTYIFDSSPGQSLLFFADSNDVTAKVKARLGIQ